MDSFLDSFDTSNAGLDRLWDIFIQPLPVGVAHFDRRLVLLRFNPAWEHSQPHSGAPWQPGAAAADIFAAAPECLERMQRCLQTGEPQRQDAVRIAAHGRITWWDVTLLPVKENGAVRGLLDLRLDAGQRMQLLGDLQDLEQRMDERTHRLQMLNAVSELVSRSLDLGEIMQASLDKMLDLMAMEMGIACRVLDDQPDGQLRLGLVSHANVSLELEKLFEALPLSGTILERAAQNETPAVWMAARHPMPAIRQAMVRAGVKLGISVPLVAKERLVGAIFLGTRTVRPVVEEELSLLQAIGRQIGVALENARLYDQAEQSAALAERNRLARDLHDSVTQSLYSISLWAEAALRLLDGGEQEQAAAHMRDLRDTAREALREMRLLIFELRPPALEHCGLAAALQARLEAVEERGGIHTELRIEGVERLPRTAQEQCYQIAREALNNLLKHSQARHAHILLRFSPSLVHLEIQDDGVGFDPAAPGKKGGLGLQGMKERAQKIGADLRILSAPGEGTQVIVDIPV